ncbi:MAG: helix-turn-helix domain-containing protein [Solirubrobacterales bacterium]|nr:helix-turn-helix domain-containing protein [Solirubrobacterales bacterium]
MESNLSDQSILGALGSDLRRLRLSRNLSQAGLAAEAGVTRDTIRRLEAGESVSTQTLVRVLRALDLLGALAGLFPDRGPGPLEQLERGPAGRQRARASSRETRPSEEWRWADGEDQ